MGAFTQAKKTFKDEMSAQKAEKEARKKEREAEGPLRVRIWNFIKRWAVRLFHTFFMLLFIYLVVISCTSLIPAGLGYIIGSLGYSLSSMAEVLLAFFSGLFFTAWIFVGTLFLVKQVGKVYIRNIKKTLPQAAIERMKELEK